MTSTQPEEKKHYIVAKFGNLPSMQGWRYQVLSGWSIPYHTKKEALAAAALDDSAEY